MVKEIDKGLFLGHRVKRLWFRGEQIAGPPWSTQLDVSRPGLPKLSHSIELVRHEMLERLRLVLVRQCRDGGRATYRRKKLSPIDVHNSSYK